MSFALLRSNTHSLLCINIHKAVVRSRTSSDRTVRRSSCQDGKPSWLGRATSRAAVGSIQLSGWF